MPKRTIIPIEHLSMEIQKLHDVLNSEKDLSAILVATSYIEASLGAILERKLIRSTVSEKMLDVRGGVLGTFSARADMCYTLGIINKPLYKDLITIANIRNEVAHHYLELDFNHPKIRELCDELAYVKTLRDGATNKPLIVVKWMVGAKNKFKISVTMISQRLLLIGLGIHSAPDVKV